MRNTRRIHLRTKAEREAEERENLASQKLWWEQILREFEDSTKEYRNDNGKYNKLPASLKFLYNPDKVVDDIVFGGIEWPEIPERDSLKKLPDNFNKLAQTEFVLIAEATEFIETYLKWWIKQDLTPELNYWYQKIPKPFTNRLIPIQETCKKLVNMLLPARLPAFQQPFEKMYEHLTQVASEADSARFDNLKDSINNFKSASNDFLGTIIAIHSGAMENIDKAAQENTVKQNGSDTPITLREFMREYCEPLTKNLRESRVKALQGLNEKEKLTPPLERIGNYVRGKSDKYLPSFLIDNWLEYIKQLPSLPKLKQ